MSVLKEIVVCKFARCNQVYNDARILPCGNRTCAAHIEAMMVKSDGINSGDGKMIKCHFCEKIHSFSDDGGEFPVDRNIPLLLSMKHCNQHDAAKKSFKAVTQLLEKLTKLDKDAYVIDYFERVEADILREKEVNIQKLNAYYQELVDSVHVQKVKCFHNLATNETLPSELDAIKQALVDHKDKLKKDNLDFLLKTLDGDDAKWKQIRSECNALLKKIKPLGRELNKKIFGNPSIQFMPGTSGTIGSICGHLSSEPIDSRVLSNDKMKKDLVHLCKMSGKQFKLLYRATRDGFGASDFHAKCDNLPNTLTVIKTTKGFIFGGYTAVEWDNTSNFKSDEAFIFSLVNALSTPLLSPVRVGSKDSIYCHRRYGPIFGGGNDFSISDNSNRNAESRSNLGCSFAFTLFSFESTEARSFLTGDPHFQTTEIEVFQLK